MLKLPSKGRDCWLLSVKFCRSSTRSTFPLDLQNLRMPLLGSFMP